MEPTQQRQVQIKADDKVLRGLYANAMQVHHTQEEFVLDFLNVLPPSATLGARVVVSPGHAKRIFQAMKDNIQKYEIAFGAIEATPGPIDIGLAKN
jgi:hypothetical protein